jgi:hypothetical protein
MKTLRKRLTRWQQERRLIRALARQCVRDGHAQWDPVTQRARVLGRWVTDQALAEHGHRLLSMGRKAPPNDTSSRAGASANS